MEIKYLKDAPLGKKGEIATVQDYEAKALITLGFAEEYKLLMNLNGTPVVDNFGSFVHVPNEVESPLKKGKKANKG